MKTISKKKVTKITFGIVLVISLAVGLVYYNFKLYLPDLPVEGVTKKQAYEKIFNRYNSIVYLNNANGYNWYIYQGNQKNGGTELIKQFNTLGFRFKEQMGSGYVFIKDNGKVELVVESEKWTSKYIIYQVPDEVQL
ncbi:MULTISPECIES: hypothetical protein [unclassified Paenibacillus]|uniref:hypothetical protein n=1 Tax=unclassified Paenibacillus TaxID=185978 RepID=UPI001AEA38B3|nr:MULTISPECIES: hypothetical protein [unclassified Paenibacillus]MBP1155072.1 putative RNA binding protein YcfA (HicA-like mRNA interferase family) [Paenibacillus sp. PvP091]MBP1169545.1 putative RNA binding protein YcfA (HicA-like mRNA interferase family) [Paenibacillus sp. PvR098]MBP2440573.1 putative RNA binding protein YcfA (HicA-like mRNA interferase family) [Paenibacillus sp. PvP052]